MGLLNLKSCTTGNTSIEKILMKNVTAFNRMNLKIMSRSVMSDLSVLFCKNPLSAFFFFISFFRIVPVSISVPGPCSCS